MTGRFKRPCLKCGALIRGASYCDEHQPPRGRPPETPERKEKKKALYGGAYKRLAKQVKATATHCHICGQGFRPDDPWEADHVLPGSMAAGLAPAHRSCNQRKSNKLKPRGRGTPRGG